MFDSIARVIVRLLLEAANEFILHLHDTVGNNGAKGDT